jgi:hypothetical protein
MPHSKAKAQREAYRESLFLCGGGTPVPPARSAHQPLVAAQPRKGIREPFIRGKKNLSVPVKYYLISFTILPTSKLISIALGRHGGVSLMVGQLPGHYRINSQLEG